MGIEQCVPLANRNSMVVSMMETVEAGEAIEELMQVPGVDAFFFGGHDYSASAGYPGTASEPPVVERLNAVQRKLRERRMPSGLVTFNTKDIPQRLEQGYRMIGLGFDTTLFIKACADALAAAGRPIQDSTWA
jgi:2-keto-3-deoxy-L-rhamnonate aldolase RhmA